MPMPQHRGLRVRRRPAGEQQHADVLWVDEGMFPRHRLVHGRGELCLGDHPLGTAGSQTGDLVVVGDHQTAGDASEDPRNCSSGAR